MNNNTEKCRRTLYCSALTTAVLTICIVISYEYRLETHELGTDARCAIFIDYSNIIEIDEKYIVRFFTKVYPNDTLPWYYAFIDTDPYDGIMYARFHFEDMKRRIDSGRYTIDCYYIYYNSMNAYFKKLEIVQPREGIDGLILLEFVFIFTSLWACLASIIFFISKYVPRQEADPATNTDNA